jgi:hypothetical protein
VGRELTPRASATCWSGRVAEPRATGLELAASLVRGRLCRSADEVGRDLDATTWRGFRLVASRAVFGAVGSSGPERRLSPCADEAARDFGAASCLLSCLAAVSVCFNRYSDLMKPSTPSSIVRIKENCSSSRRSSTNCPFRTVVLPGTHTSGSRRASGAWRRVVEAMSSRRRTRHTAIA